MLLSDLASVIALGGAGWLAVIAVKYLLPRVLGALRARRQRIMANPGDHVLARVARIGPSQHRALERTRKAQVGLARVDERVAKILTAFKDGAEPSHRFKLVAIAMFVVWLISIVSAVLLDLPIIVAVSGGNVFYGILGTLLLLCVPVIAALLIGELFFSWRSRMAFLPFSAALAVLLTTVVATVAVLASLAHIRAEVQYSAAIATAQRNEAAAKVEGNQASTTLAEQGLSELQQQQSRSTEWNTALVPIAAGAEFASGFFMPLAVPVLELVDAQSIRRKRQAAVTAAQNRVNRQNARHMRALSRRFERLGLSQAELREHLAVVSAENRGGEPAAATGAPAPASSLGTREPVRPPVWSPPAAGGAGGTERRAGQDPERTPRSGARASASRPAPAQPRPPVPAPAPDLPDDSFDLS